MPSPEYTDRHDTAILWEQAGQTRHNEPTLRKPVEIKVRWNSNFSNSNTATTDLASFSAKVIVAQAIPIGSIMWLGKMGDLPTIPLDLHQVSGLDEMRDIKGRATRRELTLQRFNDTLPDLAD